MVIVNLTRATTRKGFVRTERANDLQFSLAVKVLPSNNSKNSSLCRGYEYQVGKSVPLSCEYGDPQFWGPRVYEIVAFKHVIKLSPLSVFLGCIFSHHLCSRRQFLWCMFAIICFLLLPLGRHPLCSSLLFQTLAFVSQVGLGSSTPSLLQADHLN